MRRNKKRLLKSPLKEIGFTHDKHPIFVCLYIYIYMLLLIISLGFGAYLGHQAEWESWIRRRWWRSHRYFEKRNEEEEEIIYRMLKELYERILEKLIIQDSLEKMLEDIKKDTLPKELKPCEFIPTCKAIPPSYLHSNYGEETFADMRNYNLLLLILNPHKMSTEQEIKKIDGNNHGLLPRKSLNDFLWIMHGPLSRRRA